MTITRLRTVAIIGSGFSGICAFLQVKKELDIISTVFEINEDVGGTWLTSTYPGCACDVPSQLYCLSSELNPNWTEVYSSQEEILTYIKKVCEKNNVYENIRFKNKVKQVVWLDDQWELKVENEKGEIETFHFDIVFSGTGSLRIPHIPSVFKKFNGPVIHTGEWDHSIDYKDKRVALVGSGSSATQILPFLTKECSHVALFQRSTSWIFPKVQKTISSNTRKLFSFFPFLMIIYRWFLILYYEHFSYRLVAYPNSNFTKKTANQILTCHQDYLNQNGRHDLISKLMPTSQIGCRRSVQSDDFFSSVIQDHVSVIREEIKNIQGNIIITEDGSEREVDLIVLGTGYETQEGILGELEIIGKEGQSLNQSWGKEAPQLYKSTMIHGYPNLFILLGPYSLTGHISVILMAEIQVNYAVKCMKEIKTIIEIKKQVQDEYMNQLRSNFKGTSWSYSCHSWYKNQSGEITSLYPNSVSRFWWELGQFNKLDYY